jgi:metal-sulfur cluster biosynthetic enzyme/Fe-S cluster assembly iron-binding protein IscA
MPNPSAPPASGRKGYEPEALRLRASPDALAALRGALVGSGTGKGLRVWVETGIHPQVRMMFDRPTPRDEQVLIEGVPVFVDSLSRRFLQDAEIQYVRVGGQSGFRVVGPNAPGSPEGAATGTDEARAVPPDPSSTRGALEEKIRSALKQVYDPEIPMNLVDLGLIYGISWEGNDSVTIRMSLTSVGCPSTEQICEEVERVTREASQLPHVKVDVVWEPPWTPERMTTFAKRQFGYL